MLIIPDFCARFVDVANIHTNPIIRMGISMLMVTCSVTVLAAPTVTSVSGSPTNGAEIVITGSSFGTRSRPGPALYDRVDNQSAYGTVAAGVHVPVGSGYPWGINTFGYNKNVIFSKAFPRHADAPIHYRTTSYRGFLQWPAALGGTQPPSSQSRIYLSFWFRPDSSIDVPGHSSKFMRIWDDNDGVGTRVSWTQMHLTYDPDRTNWGNWGGDSAAWNRLELLVDANKKTVQAWTNGQLQHTATDFGKNPDFSSLGLSASLIGWDPGGTSPPKVDASFGEIYIDTSPARVEICDQPAWTLCKRREFQIAMTWSDSRVTFKLQRGAFPSTAVLYAYVVDSTGAVSAKGFALDGAAPLEPRSPTAVVVE